MPMLSFDSIPQARLVRKGGRELPAPPMPRAPESSLTHHVREAFVIALGLWPLTAIVLLGTGLLIMAGNYGAP